MATRFADHRTHAPLEIETAPGGVTEWYRGAYEEILHASVGLPAVDLITSTVDSCRPSVTLI